VICAPEFSGKLIVVDNSQSTVDNEISVYAPAACSNVPYAKATNYAHCRVAAHTVALNRPSRATSEKKS
jgi:hypothetical protein